MKNCVQEEIVSIIQHVIGNSEDKKTQLHEPRFCGNEWEYVKQCIDTGWVSSVGSFVDRFEKELSDFTSTRRAVAVVNGTAALHICLKLVDVRPDDEVLIPALTFIATSNAVTYCGAIPHFVDSDFCTLGIDPYRLDKYLDKIAKPTPEGSINRHTGRRIKAVVPMHTFGHPVDIDGIAQVCQKYDLELVEDAAESLGSYYKGKHTGGFGRVAALSFNGNKIITTGGGGAVLTNDEKLGVLAKHLTTTAKAPHAWAFNHDQIGYNYRLPNINAALGCAQLEQLPRFLESKRSLAERYRAAFEQVPYAIFVTEPADTTSNYWLNTILLEENVQELRDEILAACHSHGILTRPVWTLMSKLPMYLKNPSMDLNVAENLERRLINLPSSPFL